MYKCISRTCAVYMNPGLVSATTTLTTAYDELGRGYFATDYHKPIMPCSTV